ncbi:MAG: 3-hexulose-6-phosphate synthase [Candidatus Firestonebacteria bacterium]
MKPILQLALDFVDLSRAVKVAEEAVGVGVDWIEIGTPLIKSEGLNAVRKMRELFPKHKIIADMKIMDTGRAEVEIAAKAGANIIDVLGAASDSTIAECVEACKNYGAEVIVDMIDVADPVKRAKQVEALGVHYISVHTSIDQQMKGKVPFDILKQVCRQVKIPVAVAGGINSENVVDAISCGASIIIVGGAISKAENVQKATLNIKKAMSSGKKVKTDLYKRVTDKDVKDIFLKVSSSNISDAMHRKGELKEIFPICYGVKMIGPAVTVRTYPGDWAKPVEAIDIAQKGDVIVIDAGGVSPAIWGELATHSSIVKKISGVVINGAIRDTKEIRDLKFPAFAKLVTPTAGEPRGFGEINIPITISGVQINPGDWIIGDDDGVVVVPKSKLAEIANRSMDVLERENRIRAEIKQGGTLASVTQLLRWEKH